MNLGVLQVMSCGEHFAGLWVIQWTGGCSLQEHWPVGQLSGSLQPQLTFGDLSLCYPRWAKVWAYKRSHTAFPQATVMGMGWNKMTLERERILLESVGEMREKCQSGEGKVRSWYSHLTLADQISRVTKWHGQRWLLHVGIRSLIHSCYAQHGPDSTFWTERTPKQPLSE